MRWDDDVLQIKRIFKCLSLVPRPFLMTRVHRGPGPGSGTTSIVVVVRPWLCRRYTETVVICGILQNIGPPVRACQCYASANTESVPCDSSWAMLRFEQHRRVPYSTLRETMYLGHRFFGLSDLSCQPSFSVCHPDRLPASVTLVRLASFFCR